LKATSGNWGGFLLEKREKKKEKRKRRKEKRNM